MNLLIKIPTRERGFEWLQDYLNKIDSIHTRILLSLDDNDPQVVPAWVENNPIIYIRRGISHGKIHAINRDIDDYINDFDILLVGSDDMWPQVGGFDRVIMNDMQAHFPDTDGCLWYDTENSEGELLRRLKRHVQPGSKDYLNNWICMMPVMGKAYYKRFNYVYHPAYKSFWCDNEQTRVAQRLGKIRYLHNRIISHEHYNWGGGMQRDGVYMQAEENGQMSIDMATYKKRERHGFPA